MIPSLNILKTSFTKTSIKTSLKVLISVDWIKVSVHGGEASIDDYAAAVTDSLIPLMFEADGPYEYQIKKSESVKGEVSFNLKGQEDVKREYCIAINLRALKMFPELINE